MIFRCNRPCQVSAPHDDDHDGSCSTADLESIFLHSVEAGVCLGYKVPLNLLVSTSAELIFVVREGILYSWQ